MKYMGSKARHAKELLPIILANRAAGQMYVEPFVGGANMIDKVEGSRVGCDINEYLVAMWQAVSGGWTPPKLITEEQYIDIRNNKDADKALTAYAGFAMSFGGKWFGGYRRDVAGTKACSYLRASNEQKQSRTSFNSFIKQQKDLLGVQFIHQSYDTLDLRDSCIIYCDPPYKGTTQYKDAFNHDEFYAWCRIKHQEGHQVFVSEYNMPDDFKGVWSKEVNNSLTKDTEGKKGVERLFTL